jgi:proteasome accessory factor B
VPNAPVRVPAEERLFSLVLALLATESGLTKTEILSTVQGYRQRFDAAGGNANLERQFERDKDDIRELGVPLETVEDPGDPGNNQALRYRIPRAGYELPADLRFTPQEVTLLDLAGRVWREGSLSAESRRALLKLGSLGVAPEEPLIGYAPRLRVREPAFDALSAAMAKGQRVRFAYLKPGEAAARTRTVEPLALVQHEGRWHLTGTDVEADGSRTFLLRRIIGPVRTAGAFTAPDGDHSAAALAGLEEVWQRNLALVRIEPGTDARLRLARRRGAEEREGGVVALHFTDARILADELAGYGPEVLVLEPAELRAAVLERLEAAAAANGGSDG